MRLPTRLLLLLVLLLVASSNVVNAKVINTDATSSYWTKVTVGIRQGIHWLSEWIGPYGRAPAGRPPRTVKLALVGLGRTGSTSFSAALKQLGYAPIHDDEAMEVSTILRDMFRGDMTYDEANAAFGAAGFDAPMMPLHNYVRWAATAPHVQVVLTVRDSPKKWAESWLSVAELAYLTDQRPFSWIPVFQDLRDINVEMMANVPTNGRPEKYTDIPTLEAGYEAWNQFVMDTIPADRLLVFNVKQGWEPLCDFLGVPVPEGPFPHINDRVVVDAIIKVFIALTWIWPLFIIIPCLGLYYVMRWILVGGGSSKSTARTKRD